MNSPTRQESMPHKILQIEKKGRFYWLVKYSPKKGVWCNKYAPSSLACESDVEKWFHLEFVPSIEQMASKSEAKSISNILPLWKIYKKNDPNIFNMLGHVNNWIANHEIYDLDIAEHENKVEVCRSFIRGIDRAPYTVRNVVQTLRVIIDDARVEGWIPRKTVNMFREKDVRKVINNGKKITKRAGKNTIALNLEAAMQLISREPKGVYRFQKKMGKGNTSQPVERLANGSPLERRVRYVVALTSGLRDGELSGLEWRDLVGSNISVERQLKLPTRAQRQAGECGTLTDPKLESFRTLPLHPSAIEALKWWREEGWKAWVGREPNDLDPIFSDQGGKHYRPNSARLLRIDLKHAGLPTGFVGKGDGKLFPFEFHALRRTFAQLLEKVGLERSKISALMGHTAGDVTAEHYLDNTNLANAAEELKKLPFVWEK